VKPDFQALRSAGLVIGGVGAFFIVANPFRNSFVSSSLLILNNVTHFGTCSIHRRV
jgi:hypothetical protein